MRSTVDEKNYKIFLKKKIAKFNFESTRLEKFRVKLNF